MNSNDIFDGVTDIRDDLIEGEREAPKKRPHWLKRRWPGLVAAVLAVAIVGGILLRPNGGMTAHAAGPIAVAEYPRMAPYPDDESKFGGEAYRAWRDSVAAQQRDLGDISALQTFFARSSRTFLTGEPGENRVYSPLNVYMALAMLAQLTGGESREQLLTLLGSDSIEALRQQASDVWNSNYRDDGALTSILASSLWLNEEVDFHQGTMDILARDFYASSFQGEMGSEEFDQALQNWLNEQTGGLLGEQAGNIRLDPDTVLALATTVYFKGSWHDEFTKGLTAPQTFHTPTGDVQTDFMHQFTDQFYYWGDSFAAVSQPFETGGAMWFLLPDEGVTPEALLSDAQAVEFLFTTDKSQWEQKQLFYVDKSIPKFDVSSQFELEDGLQVLGVTDVFDPWQSDFTPMTDMDHLFVAQANHAARVVIDEEGCTAAAFTVITINCESALALDTVDFVLDRPFVFCITGDSGLPLFVGIVNYPTGA